jgi:8-oxo-dGTP diphosphatase
MWNLALARWSPVPVRPRAGPEQTPTLCESWRMTGGTSRQVVAAVVRRGDEIVLVRQQGPDDPAPNWALPGGVVEPGELLYEALARELREETGLAMVRPTRLLNVSQLKIPEGRWAGTWTAFAFEVDIDGEIDCADPDGLVLEARWVGVQEAVRLLSALSLPSMRDPIVAYLRGRAEVPTVWVWPRGLDQPPEVVPPLSGE